MPYQAPITIKKALDSMHRHDYVLPAIQREFVWTTDQVCRLFDSLMRGYPIGSFLFWKVRREKSRDFVFYDFIRDYHELKSPHCPKLELPADRELTAILDGQQRLTAFNIALCGSHAEKEPRKWKNNLDAYPAKRLYVNLMGFAEENEQGLQYDFRFLTEDRAKSEESESCHWFRVSQILDMEPGPGVFRYIQDAGLAEHKDAYFILDRLHRVVHVEQPINYYEEEEQELEKVLDIFIRMNSAGTPLSYSDILLSMATAEWEDHDARDAIYGLVDELNDTRLGFNFTKDLVLKTGLTLAEIPSVAFRVVNFNSANMRNLEERWVDVDRALRLSVQLLADLGFSGQTLGAGSVVIPLAYYMYKGGLDRRYLTAASARDDREHLRYWVLRSLVKAGVWGSGLDTLLVALRSAIRDSGRNGFPSEEIEAVMTKRGKSLRFEEDEIQDLADLHYKDKRTFPVLALMYPFVDFRNQFHIDHVFPQAAFKRRNLSRSGIPRQEHDQFVEYSNRLANLHLLEGPYNQAKKDQLPKDWLLAHFPDEVARASYCDRHDFSQVPEQLMGFPSFYERRREQMMERLRGLLGMSN